MTGQKEMTNADAIRILSAYTVPQDEELVREAIEKAIDSMRELRNCRNELCVLCGRYKESNNKACRGCRWEDFA